MKKIFFIIFIFMFTINIYPDTSGDFNLINDSRELRDSFYPNDEGSQNEKKLINYIETFSKNFNYSFNIEKIEDDTEVTNSYNIEIIKNNNSKKNEQIVIFCPLNSPIIQQNYSDNSVSIQIVFNLMNEFQKLNLNKNIVFVFSGANGRENNYNYNGIRKYINSKKNLSKSFFIVLDILGNNSKINFSGSLNKKPIPALILKQYLKINKNKLDIQFDKNEIIRSKFNLITINSYSTYLLSQNIQTISFSNREKGNNNLYIEKEKINNLSKYFYDWIIAIDKINFPIDLDYNYIYLKLFNHNFIIQEFVLVSFILILIFLTIFLRLILPNLKRLRINSVIRIFPYFLFLFLIFFILSFLPLLIFIPAQFITGLKNIYLNFPILYFLCVFIVPLMIIFLLFDVIHKFPFPRHNYIYIFGAISFSFINLTLFLIIDISFVYVFLWVVILITLSNLTGKNYLLKFVFYLLTPFPLIKLLYDISFLSDFNFVNNNFIIPVLQNLLFCFITFPFLLLFIRIQMIFRFKFKILLNKMTFVIILIATLIISLFFLIILSTKIFPVEPVIYADLISENNAGNLILTSNKKIEKIVLKTNKNSNIIHLNSYYKYNLGNITKPYKIDFNNKIIENHYLINLKINSEFDIEYIKLYLITPVSYYPLDSNYLYKNETSYNNESNNEEIYSFFIPRNINKNFNLNLVLLPNKKYQIKIEIDYPSIESKYVEINSQTGFIYKKSKFLEYLKF